MVIILQHIRVSTLCMAQTYTMLYVSYSSIKLGKMSVLAFKILTCYCFYLYSIVSDLLLKIFIEACFVVLYLINFCTFCRYLKSDLWVGNRNTHTHTHTTHTHTHTHTHTKPPQKNVYLIHILFVFIFFVLVICQGLESIFKIFTNLIYQKCI